MSDAPFWDYPSLIDHLAWNVIHDGDNVIVVDGAERSGKSVLCWKLLEDVGQRTEEHLANLLPKEPHRQAEIDRFPEFIPHRDVILDWEDWVAGFDAKRRYARYLFDEGGNLAFSRDYSRGEQKGLVKLLMQAGQLNATLIFAMPNLEFMDRYVREHRTQIRIHVWRKGYQRGFATVQWKQTRWRKGTFWYEDVIDELRFSDITKGPQWYDYLTKKERALNTTTVEAVEAASTRVSKGKSKRKAKA